MSTITEIEAAFDRLSLEEQGELMERLEQRQLMLASSTLLFQMYDREEEEQEQERERKAGKSS